VNENIQLKDYEKSVNENKSPSSATEFGIIGNVVTENAIELIMAGDIAILTDQYSGIKCINISNPYAPQIIGSLDTSQAHSIALNGNYLYLGDMSGGFRCINVSNPIAPTLLSTYPLGSGTYGLDYFENVVYQSEWGGSTVYILDLSNPTTPQLKGTIAVQAKQVLVSGSLLFLAKQQSVAIYNISTPINPIFLDEYTFSDGGSATERLWCDGNILFATRHNAGFTVLDIKNPSDIQYIKTYDTPGDCVALKKQGDLIVVGDGTSGVHLYNATDILNIVLMKTYNAASYMGGFDFWGNILVIADGTTGIKCIKIMEYFTPVMLGRYDTAGSATDLFIDGSIAYVADGAAGLQIFNISNPSNPALLGTYDTTGSANDVVVYGGIAYVADWGSGFLCINVTNPTNPQLIGSVDTSGNANGIFIQGNIAYVADHVNGLQLVNITNPTAPTLLGNYNTPNYAQKVFVSGDIAFIPDTAVSLYCFNVSDPNNIILIGTLDLGTYAMDVIVSGQVAYVVDQAQGLWSINVTNPKTPSLLGTNYVAPTPLGLTVDGPMAFIANDGYLLEINITNPKNLVYYNNISTPEHAYGVAVCGNFAYIAAYDGGISIYKIANYVWENDAPIISSPLDRSYYEGSQGNNITWTITDNSIDTSAYTIYCNGTVNATGTWNNGSQISIPVDGRTVGYWNWSIKATDGLGGVTQDDVWVQIKNLQIIGSNNSFLAHSIVTKNNIAYIAASTNGLRIMNISDPYNPDVLSELDIGNNFQGIFVSEFVAYVVDNFDNLLYAIDVNNPTNPQVLDTIVIPGPGQEVFVQGQYAYVAAREGGLFCVDITDPNNLQGLGTYSCMAVGIYVEHDIAFVTGGTNGFWCINISNPSNPTYIGSYSIPGYGNDVWGIDGLVFVAGGAVGITCLNVTNLSSPQFLWTWDSIAARGIMALDGIVFVADYNGGFYCLNISNPSAPKFIAKCITPGNAYAVDIFDQYAFIANEAQGLQIVDMREIIVYLQQVHHTPILIDGNVAFTNANGVLCGDGTLVNPYIIENWNINATTAHGIEIRNTDKYFVIKNCTVVDGITNTKYGIYLNNVTNGVIFNNILKNNRFGIYLNAGNNNRIINNTEIYNDYGILLEFSSNNNSIINNTAMNNEYGIYLNGASNNTIFNNTASTNTNRGIRLVTASNNNVLWNNNISNNLFENAACESSTGNQWFINQTGNYYGDYNAKYPGAINDGRVWNTPYAIDGNAGDQDLFPLVAWGNITNDYPNLNSPADLNLPIGATGQNITWIVTDTTNLTTAYWIYIHSIFNRTGSWINGQPISFTTDGMGIGNWNVTIIVSDGIGANVSDTVWVQIYNEPPNITSPFDISYIQNQVGHNITWMVTDSTVNGPSYSIYRNGTWNQTKAWVSGVSFNVSVDGLGVGYWNITIIANDGYDAIVSDEVWVHVVANTNPTITGPEDWTYIYGTTNHYLNWTPIDPDISSAEYYIFRNGTQVFNGSWITAGNINITIEGLSTGYYNYTLILYDGLGGMDTDEVWGYVEPSTVPVITPSGDVTIHIGSPPQDLTWTISDITVDVPTYRILRNGTEIENGGWVSDIPVVIYISGLPLGIYNYTIIADDGYGNFNQDTVIVTIDNPNPTINSSNDLNFEMGSGSHEIVWNITDPNYSTTNYVVYFNHQEYTTGTWVSGQAIIISVGGLGIGTYNFTIIGTDGYGGWVSDEVWVNVTNTVPTISNPADVIYVVNSIGNILNWTITDPNVDNPGLTFYLNGSTYGYGGWISGIPIVVNIDGLSIGTYNLTIIGADGYGASVSDSVWITVINILPSLSSPTDQSWVFGTTGYNISWIVSDNSTQAPMGYTIYQNNTIIATGIWTTNGTPILLNLDGLAAGSYAFTCMVNDGFPNGNASDTVIVTVYAQNLPPAAPVLNEIIPNPSTTGNITLTWSIIPGVTVYQLYRSEQIITQLGGTEVLITNLTNPYYSDLNLPNGTYYYVVRAYNSSGYSNVSNCVSVLVQIPPSLPPTNTTTSTTTTSSSTTSTTSSTSSSSTTSQNSPQPFRVDGFSILGIISGMLAISGILLMKSNQRKLII
jgi:parallel beta-helix repeat protein